MALRTRPLLMLFASFDTAGNSSSKRSGSTAGAESARVFGMSPCQADCALAVLTRPGLHSSLTAASLGVGNPQPELAGFVTAVACLLRAERIISELDGGRDGAVLAGACEVGGE